MKRANTGYVGICTGTELGTTTSAAAAGVTVRVANPYGGRAYLVIVTASESSAATLDVAIAGYIHNGGATTTSKELVVNLTSAITANGTYVYLLGTDAATGGPATECFDFPLPRSFQVVISVTGTTSSFVTSAALAFC